MSSQLSPPSDFSLLTSAFPYMRQFPFLSVFSAPVLSGLSGEKLYRRDRNGFAEIAE